MACVTQAHSGPHNRLDILGDDVKELGEVGDQDVHHPMLERGQAQLHVRTTSWRDTLLMTPPEARATKGPLVYICRQGIEGRRLQLGDVGGDGGTPEVCLLNRLVWVFEEQRDPAALAHCTAHQGAVHDTS